MIGSTEHDICQGCWDDLHPDIDPMSESTGLRCSRQVPSSAAGIAVQIRE
jgi:hypothetical protein